MSSSSKPRSRLTLTEKTLIKAEQAAFLEKITTAQPNEHQAAIFAAAQTQQGRYVVLAGPGSGKTFTSIKASTAWKGSAIYFAYNKKIQTDTNFKLVAIDSQMVASTTHSFGLSCLQAYTRGQCKVESKEEKYPHLIKQYLDDNWHWFINRYRDTIADENLNVDAMRLDAYNWTKMLLHSAQVSLAELTPRGFTKTVNEFDLTEINQTSLTWDFVLGAVPALIEQGKAQFFGPKHLVSYDDMIYYPNVIEDVPIRQYHH